MLQYLYRMRQERETRIPLQAGNSMAIMIGITIQLGRRNNDDIKAGLGQGNVRMIGFEPVSCLDILPLAKNR